MASTSRFANLEGSYFTHLKNTWMRQVMDCGCFFLLYVGRLSGGWWREPGRLRVRPCPCHSTGIVTRGNPTQVCQLFRRRHSVKNVFPTVHFLEFSQTFDEICVFNSKSNMQPKLLFPRLVAYYVHDLTSLTNNTTDNIILWQYQQ
jgi:hypothetical protein